MYRLVIFLDDNEADALRTLAKKEYRDIRSQATLILKEELARRQSMSLATNPIQHSDLENQIQVPNNHTNKEDDNETRE